MADAPETVSTLNGLTKEVYPSGQPPILVPDETRLQQLIPFVPREKELGAHYNQPVVLNLPAGFTLAGPGAGAVTLNDSKAGQMKNAQIDGYSVLLRNQVDYEIAARAAKGRNAFMDTMSLVFETMQQAMRKRLEVEILYGSVGIGTVNVYTSGDPSITINAAEWAPGIWALCEGMNVTIYQGTTTSVRGSTVSIVAVDIENMKITLSGTVSGCISGDTVYFESGNTSSPEMAGIHKIMTNTGSLFGISASVSSGYSGWSTPQFDCSNGSLTFEKIRKGVAKGVGRGLSSALDLAVNPFSWDDLMTDLASLVRIQSAENAAGRQNGYEIGAERIRFYSQNGLITVTPSIYVKRGYAYGLTTKSWIRGGAADVSFKTPGMGDDIFLHLPTKMGYEVRSYTNQFVFCERPATQILWKNIVDTQP
jgi:hypothetical protein